MWPGGSGRSHQRRRNAPPNSQLTSTLAAASTVCDLDAVTRAVKLTVYVASAEGSSRSRRWPMVRAPLLVTAFGDVGAHAREAVGVAALPLGAPVELALVLQVD